MLVKINRQQITNTTIIRFTCKIAHRDVQIRGDFTKQFDGLTVASFDHRLIGRGLCTVETKRIRELMERRARIISGLVGV